MSWKPSDRTRVIWDVVSSVCLGMMLGMLQGGRVEDYEDETFGVNGTRRRDDLWPYDHGPDSNGRYQESMYHSMYEDS